jgi:hypothetical protein
VPSMTFRWILPCLLLAGMLTAGHPAVASGHPFATDKDFRPADRDFVSVTTTFDCEGAPVIPIAVGCDTTLRGSTVGAANQVPGYGCVAWNENGGEAIFRLEAPAGESVRLTAALDSLIGDLDLFLLTECNSEACLAYANREISLVLESDAAYYLIVDGYQGAAGPYKLRVTCLYAGLPPQICDLADTTVARVEADYQLPAQSFGGTTFERENLVESYECSPYLEKSGEVWFTLVLDSEHTLHAEVVALYFDAALWLFDGCGPASRCLRFADASLSGGTETFAYRNAGLESQRLFLAVDGFRAPESELLGTFQLTLSGSFAGRPAGICHPDSGIATAVSCTDPDTIQNQAGNLFGQPNRISAYPCDPHPEAQRGGEVWYAVTLATGRWLTAEVTPGAGANFDAALWLFDGCGASPACLAFSDRNPGAGKEWWQYRNDSEAETTVYLAVDAAEAVASEPEGEFTLQLRCTKAVPAAARSFGALKSLYR